MMNNLNGAYTLMVLSPFCRAAINIMFNIYSYNCIVFHHYRQDYRIVQDIGIFSLRSSSNNCTRSRNTWTGFRLSILCRAYIILLLLLLLSLYRFIEVCHYKDRRTNNPLPLLPNCTINYSNK